MQEKGRLGSSIFLFVLVFRSPKPGYHTWLCTCAPSALFPFSLVNKVVVKNHWWHGLCMCIGCFFSFVYIFLFEENSTIVNFFLFHSTAWWSVTIWIISELKLPILFHFYLSIKLNLTIVFFLTAYCYSWKYFIFQIVLGWMAY